MRSLFSKVARGGSRDGSGGPGSLAGRTIAVGPLTVRVEAQIGEGGFATIHAARDAATGEAYALKFVKIGTDPDAAADCRREVAVMQTLRGCPHILTLRAAAGGGLDEEEQADRQAGPAALAPQVAAGTTATAATVPAAPSPPPPLATAVRPDEAMLVMDLCTESLGDRLRAVTAAGVAGGSCPTASTSSTPPSVNLPPAEAAAVFRDVCRGVAAMHAATPPLFHRDIKAENVLLHPAGRWVLCDFGSATSWAGVHAGADAVMMAEDEVRRRTTPAYRAPELFDLYTRERLDGRVDVWALGVLLYLLACGRLPFTVGADTNKLAVLGGRYPPLPPGVPADLATLVGDLLVVSPAGRPPIAAVLVRAEALAAGLAGGGGSGGAAAATQVPQPPPPLPPAAGPPATKPGAAPSQLAPWPPPASPPRRLLSSKPAGFDAFQGDDEGQGGGRGDVSSPAAPTPPPPGASSPRGGAVAAAAATAAAATSPTAPPSGGSFWAKHAPTAAPAARSPSPPAPARDVEVSLRRQLADAMARSTALAETVREQEATIRALRLAAHDDQAASKSGGWATFGGEESAGGGGGGDPFAVTSGGSGGREDTERAASEPTPVESWRL